MRSVSLAVDVTNYLMLELGQPMHAFDRTRLDGPIVVRRARPGERLETLDHVIRDLDPDDILITDASGPISMAGTMGGLATEISESSADLVIEAAHFSATGTARMSRRHRLFSEASSRFERGVDRELPLRASAKAAAMLAWLGGGTVVPGCTHASVPVRAGHDRDGGRLSGPGGRHGLRPPDGDPPAAAGRLRGRWPDEDDADAGRDARRPGGPTLPIRPIWPRKSSGWRDTRRSRSGWPARSPGTAAAPRSDCAWPPGGRWPGSGYVEVIGSPFSSAADADLLQLPPGDRRRHATRIANPIRDDEPLLRTSLLPGLLRVLARNLGRGFADVALFEMGLVFLGPPRCAGHRAHPAGLARPVGGGTREAAGRAARSAAAPGGDDHRPRGGGGLVGRRAPGVLRGRDRGGPRGAAGQPGAVPGPGRPA